MTYPPYDLGAWTKELTQGKGGCFGNILDAGGVVTYCIDGGLRLLVRVLVG